MLIHQEQAHAPEFTRPQTIATDDVLDVSLMESEPGSKIEQQQIELAANALTGRKRLLSLRRVPILLASGSIMALIALGSEQVTGIRPVYYLLAGLFASSYSAVIITSFAGLARVNRQLTSISHSSDTAAAGVLIEALTAGELAANLAGSSLMRLLPQMTRDDLCRLTAEQRTCLRVALLSSSNRLRVSRYNPPLAVAILETLARIGDASDIGCIERVLAQKSVHPDSIDIRESAVRSAATLRARIAGHPAAQTEYVQGQHPAPLWLSERTHAVAERLRSMARLRRRNAAITAAGAVTGLAAAVASLLATHGGHPPDDMITLLMLGCLGAIFGFGMAGTYSLRNLTGALMNSDDLTIVPHLIQAAATVEAGGAAAVVLLTRLLPRLRASDAGLLDSDARTLLNTAITKHSRNTAFVCAALTALQQVGDASAIPTVRRLAVRKGRSAADAGVQAAAQECLEYLMARAAERAASDTLLRASGVSSGDTNRLLRPSSEVDGRVEALLRPLETTVQIGQDDLLHTSA